MQEKKPWQIHKEKVKRRVNDSHDTGNKHKGQKTSPEELGKQQRESERGLACG